MNFFTAIVLLIGTSLSATHPEAFGSLAKSFEEDIKAIELLKQEEYFLKHEALFKEYEANIHKTFELGFDLDRAIKTSGDTSLLKQNYLKAWCRAPGFNLCT